MRSTNKIKNSHALIQNGSSEKLRLGRSLLLQAYEYCLKRVDPYAITGAALEIDGSVMTVQGRLFDLDKYRNIFVVGAGKAGDRMAAAVENLLSGRITGGWVNIPAPVIDEESCLSRAQQPAASRIARNFAGHPLPDAAGVHGTLELLKIVEQAGVDDLVICLISGGGSSLLPLPREPLSLADKQLVTGLLLRSGADVSEINTVRKHISSIKGGWLATRCWPATVINLVLSDVIGDPLDFIASGPTVPDSTTFGDAVAVLKKYSLCEAFPAQVLQLLSAGSAGQLSETPKAHDKVFEKVFNSVIGNNLTARSAIAESLHSSGVRVVSHENSFTGSVEDAVTHIYSAFS
ncbi:MAG: glycerate-2-kinase family protein, partial [Candidatus Riflebacteria bacterium]|nr:glycerate-2-kinase family protein [Candidatus Riflebacteria bacterium]